MENGVVVVDSVSYWGPPVVYIS